MLFLGEDIQCKYNLCSITISIVPVLTDLQMHLQMFHFLIFRAKVALKGTACL